MVTINGVEEAVAGKSILEYLEEAGFQPATVVVEKNLEIIPRQDWDKEVLKDEDTVEVLRFVGGG